MRTLGIVNITDDSFSDGGRFLEVSDAEAQAKKLATDGADIIDLGAASSNPNAKTIAPALEIERLSPVVDALQEQKIPISIDTFSPQVQRWALGRSVDYLNDIQGFPFIDMYPLLAASSARLIVMHSVQGLGPATRIDVDVSAIFDRVIAFFEARMAALVGAGVARERLILDPGMGLFLGTRREASFEVLGRLKELKERFGYPVLVSVSRKSFLRTFLGRAARASGAATLAAEIFAVEQGVDYVRTHDPAALKDAIAVLKALKADGRN